ncbi:MULTISPECIES: methionyl-tRNA formyltransferase [Nitrosomonas]|uniref:Methionyl-tRNA formyltransferase n=2 Tax=Nitrosomonas TaxID=914 RepID=A0A0F7KG02_9PROT|nr:MULTISPECIES: methionyl-tRNA formyltransferase [Nitrosomonas]AKH38366.1 methionyl-tRNA formyltransferase [Nitrosomonas communis]TYP90110.1 methionyl-tRNA formyltransferase [Nitrosomonas communis]UVS60372.1 methionyl-tRNA formyltransferase [Nitrosomonas sp. PLL12]
MRIIFAGTPVFAAKALLSLLNAEYQIVLVLTQPDRPAGRGMKTQVSDVKKVAQAHDIPLLQPLTLKTETVHTQLKVFNADVMVVAAYGLILPKEVLKIPRYGCLNIHASLLPRWRGAAPIQRAILAGDQETGITIMQMDEGLDTGDMLLQRDIPVDAVDTAQTLHDKLADLGAQSIVEALELMQLGKLSATPQDETLASYAAKIQKKEAEIDWRMDVDQIDRSIRAFNPYPGAYTYFQGSLLKIWQAKAAVKNNPGKAGEIVTTGSEGVVVACGRGSLILEVVQKPGGKKMPIAEFMVGHYLQPGQFFSTVVDC